jgi:hypothetical protein
LRVVCRDLLKHLLKHHGVFVATADVCGFGRHSDELLERAVGGHADDCQRLPATGVVTDGRRGAFGDATLAAREKGQAVLAAMSKSLGKARANAFPKPWVAAETKARLAPGAA